MHYKEPVPKKIITGIWRQETYVYSTKLTKKRRRLMGVEIKEFGEIQNKLCPSHDEFGGAATPTRLYALDYLPKRYNNVLPSPSNLRCRLRERATTGSA